MSDDKIQIKVSKLRSLIREAIGEAPTIASRQSMMTTADDEDEPRDDDGSSKQLNDADEMVEVAPPGFEKAVKGLKKNKSVDNPWAVAWSMKNKGAKPTKEAHDLSELRDYEEVVAEKFDDKKYELIAKQIFDGWGTKDVDVDWAGVVDAYVRNRVKNVGQEIDKSKLYEKVLDLVEDYEEAKAFGEPTR